MKTAYICSPYSGDTKRNKQYARELTAHAIQHHIEKTTQEYNLYQSLSEAEARLKELEEQNDNN